MNPTLAIRIIFSLLTLLPAWVHAEDDGSFVPQLLGAQYTLVDQHQGALRSPYRGPLSLDPRGDTEQSHTFGAYLGIPLHERLSFYFDVEMFKGEGVSNATGLGGLNNGDVIRSGTVTLGKRAYVARRYLRYVLPLGRERHAVEAAQDQLAGEEPDRRLEIKLGKFAASDDFDKNRYANSTRSQFMNWSLFNNTAWDFAADTRGYSNGAVIGYVEPTWALHYGVLQMPTEANGQTLEWPLTRARGEQLELTWQPDPKRWVLRLLAFRDVARMGVYRDAIARAQQSQLPPDIRADDRDGRRKYGFGVNLELPIADDGETGVFARLGWNDGHTESFAFTEVDRLVSAGVQISGARWSRAQDRFGLAIVQEALSPDHRRYLELGGQGFVLGDGRLGYAREMIVETYYRLHCAEHLDLSPDLQFVRNPGYNRDRGPVRIVGLRLHLERRIPTSADLPMVATHRRAMACGAFEEARSLGKSRRLWRAVLPPHTHRLHPRPHPAIRLTRRFRCTRYRRGVLRTSSARRALTRIGRQPILLLRLIRHAADDTAKDRPDRAPRPAWATRRHRLRLAGLDRWPRVVGTYTGRSFDDTRAKHGAQHVPADSAATCQSPDRAGAAARVHHRDPRRGQHRLRRGRDDSGVFALIRSSHPADRQTG
jgi:hypothetical protein